MFIFIVDFGEGETAADAEIETHFKPFVLVNDRGFISGGEMTSFA